MRKGKEGGGKGGKEGGGGRGDIKRAQGRSVEPIFGFS